jgi:hypothetical protein
MVVPDQEELASEGNENMNEVCSFMSDFISREFAARKAAYAERDKSAFDLAADAVNACFSPKENLRFYQAWNYSEEVGTLKARARESTLANMRALKLFLIRRYEHARYGELFRCYVDNGTKQSDRYATCYFIAKLDLGWRIVAQWGICVSCMGMPNDDGPVCTDCQGNGWEPAGGARLGDLGQARQVRRFEAPLAPSNRADYDRD